MNFSNKFSEIARYVDRLISKVAALPAKDYPPANIAAWIKVCKDKGRNDLAKQIMDQWNKVVDKYPTVRVSWPAAVKISAASIKKNVFGHEEFTHWLEDQLGVSSEEATQIERSIPEPPAAHHPIEVPSDTETPEDWSNAAKKTAGMLAQLDEAFGTAEEQIKYLKTEITSLNEKIEKYGPGGAKSGGKLSERVPKWQAQLKEYESKLGEVDGTLKKEKARVKKLDTQYNNKRITTVKYEEGVQSALQDTLQFILANVNDPEKQKNMLLDLQKLMKKMDDNGGQDGAPSRAANLKTAGFWDKIISAFSSALGYLEAAWDTFISWAKSIVTKVDEVDSAINPF